MALLSLDKTSLLLALLLLGACGQQGPLIPAQAEEHRTSAPISASNATESEPTP